MPTPDDPHTATCKCCGATIHPESVRRYRELRDKIAARFTPAAPSTQPNDPALCDSCVWAAIVNMEDDSADR